MKAKSKPFELLCYKIEHLKRKGFETIFSNILLINFEFLIHRYRYLGKDICEDNNNRIYLFKQILKVWSGHQHLIFQMITKSQVKLYYEGYDWKTSLVCTNVITRSMTENSNNSSGLGYVLFLYL